MLKNLPQLMLSAEKEAIIDSSDEIILENIFYKYKLSKFTKKKICISSTTLSTRIKYIAISRKIFKSTSDY